MKKTFDVQEIMTYLPHRYPFLLVDRIIELIPGERVTAIKNVTINEHFFQGHFPSAPIMPGVLIVEAMGQAGGILAYESITDPEADRTPYFMGMDKVRFRKPVVPGDQLVLEVKIIRLRTKMIKLAGIARVDQKVAAEAELMAALGAKA
ncbi:MAG: 3-hydroxyacyl-ACP dehydratase FabZ [Desulfobacterales bacterium]